MAGLKVVCLISGGKDSLFSILHCLKNGHEVVAIANLHPPAGDGDVAVEDLDSYMYQTVGHTAIPLYEKALGLPLYRVEITGKAMNQDKCYGRTSDEDETEALVPLLRQVQAHHPELNAVSTGAILSDYQRTRVESVAVRLGLIPLSYLWQWPNLRPHTQDSLLRDMAAVGQDSRIIKVASGGLDESMLWQNVCDPQTINRLNKAVARFGSADDGAVLGEGGEYETLAIAGPRPLWKGRIIVPEENRQVVAGEAGSASVRVLGANVDNNSHVGGDIGTLRNPSILEPEFQAILDEHRAKHSASTPAIATDRTEHGQMLGAFDAETDDKSTAIRSDHHVLLSDLYGEGKCAADQMRSIMEQASSTLHASGHGLSDVAYSSIILRNMADFPSINAAYGTYFTRPNPPARATIACASILPEGKHLMVTLTSIKTSHPDLRRGLHVQSRSYWAPANIGPYSQAIQVHLDDDSALVFIAGQIPLLPASMDLPPLSMSQSADDAFMLQTVLALQHLDRIGRVMQVTGWAYAIAFITAASYDIAQRRSGCARRVWDAYHRIQVVERGQSANADSDNEDFDIWHAKFGSTKVWGRQIDSGGSATSLHVNGTATTPPLYAIRVDALPRGSPIEWVSFGSPKDGPGNAVPHLEHLLRVFRGRII